MEQVKIGDISVGDGAPLLIIAGPCVIESEKVVLQTAAALQDICSGLGLPLLFKSSYDKANRTSVNSYRGPGLRKGLQLLARVSKEVGVPVISDVHSIEEISSAAAVLDVMQIPALLCRQTDIILAASRTGKPVNVKKGQFLAPWDVSNIIGKFTSTGNRNLLITERGTSFGYNNLVVDFRSIPLMRSLGFPVVFDVTHSVQLPGGKGNCSDGQREFAEPLAKAAVAVGVDGLFLEVHPSPEQALCDGPNMLPLHEVEGLLRKLLVLRAAASAG